MADIQVILTIPEDHISRIQEACTGMKDKAIQFNTVNKDNLVLIGYDFKYADSSPKAVLRKLVHSFISLYEKTKDYNRYHDEVHAIPTYGSNTPEDIII